MKQVIFLGFYCQIYKKAPVARIYVGDVMIDEIEIPEFYPDQYIKGEQLSYLTDKNVDYNYIKYQINFSPTELSPMIYEKIHPLDNYWWQKQKANHLTFEEICVKLDPTGKTKENIQHPKIFVYIIDDEILKSSQCKIKIEIKNSDSNYVNGFMSKSTLLYLSTFYVIPYTLLEDPINYTQKYLEIYSRKSTAHRVEKIISWYKKRIQWPLNLNHHFQLSNDQKENKKAIEHVFGGDSILEIKMKKKYGLYWPEKMNTKGFFWINYLFIKDFIVGLSNKYKLYENQRSIN